VIAVIEAPDPDVILSMIVDEIRYVEGVMDTVTCFGVRAGCVRSG